MSTTTVPVMQRSRKLSRSGYRITELYTELDSALLASDPERACCLTAELACTIGGQTRSIVCFLIDTYCSRCVNSCRAQLNLLHSSLAYIGDGTTKSPHASACLEAGFRRGLCALTLLVTCGGLDPAHNVGAAFARVPRSEAVSSLDCAVLLLREAVAQRDAHCMSSVIRAVTDESWFSEPEVGCKGRGLGMPDVQRLRLWARKDPVWDLWALALELSKEVGVSEYVENCLHAFAWGYCATTKRSRVHLLWYGFLVIIKGAPRAGPHPISPAVFESALASVDSLFEDILSRPSSQQIPPPPVLSTTKTSKTNMKEAATIATAVAVLDMDTRMSYLTTITLHDPSKAWEVEKDREGAREACSGPRADALTKCVDVRSLRRCADHPPSDGPLPSSPPSSCPPQASSYVPVPAVFPGYSSRSGR